jgi:hypothetical protein
MKHPFQSLDSSYRCPAGKATGVEAPTPLMKQPRVAEGTALLRLPNEGEDLVADYLTIGLTLGRQPLALLRKTFDCMRLRTAADTRVTNHGAFASSLRSALPSNIMKRYRITCAELIFL